MKKISIKDVGPIKNVSFNLNKVNVLMGPQSSGKSTIAKVVSYCQWVEKRFILDGKFDYKVEEQLLNFHRLSANSFSKKSLIEYESDFIKIIYKGKKLIQKIELKENSEGYKKSKNIYIPSERNFVSVIPNLGKYKETNDNIMSFLYDWYTAKRKFAKGNSINILDFGVNFYNNFDEDRDVLELKESENEILLREGSSGLQSVIPLVILVEYLTEKIFYENNGISIREHENSIDNLLKRISIVNERLRNAVNDNHKDRLGTNELKKYNVEFDNLKANLTSFKLSNSTYSYTDLIIEEPEQNLFPKTQRDLVVFITTHSPYILYAINNCLLGYVIKDRIDEDVKNELLSNTSWIDPEKTSIWQIENGEMYSVIDERSKTVTKHYFNEITSEIMDEYYEMLNYFEYAEQD